MSDIIYYLATIVATAENKKDIRKIRSLSKSEFQTYTDYLKDLNEYQKENSLFEIIPLNHKDFHSKIDYYKREYKINVEDGHMIFIDLNRHILNCLFSFRTYLDHTEFKLKKGFGESSKEYTYFKELKSQAFDQNFSYRFLYKLRNYAQHCGLPSGSISFNENFQGKNLEIKFYRDALLTKYDSWGGLVIPDLEKQKSEFDVIPLLDDLVNQIQLINDKLDLVLKKKFQKQAFYLFSLINETQKKGTGTPIILKFLPGEKISNMNIGWFPIQTISRITGIPIVED
jgi:hypothetical protein